MAIDEDFLKTGLTSTQVEELTKQNKTNKIQTKTSKTYGKILFENLFTWFNIICVSIAIMLIVVGSYNNIAFIFIFLANLLIGIFQEVKAKKMVDSISVFVSTKVYVLRDGKKQQIDISKVVEGDVLFLYAGDQICCDCILKSGNVETNESLLTGESKPVKKKKEDKLLGGSFVVSGECVCVAVNVGQNTYSSTLVKKAREFKKSKSDILKTLNFIVKVIGFLLIPLGILTYVDVKNNTGSNTEALVRMAGAIISIMPVGMFLLTSVSLVVGVVKLAKHKTLVQEGYAIEMLARTSCLCLDKTGTLTDGTMKVVNFVTIGNKKSDDIKQIFKSYLQATKSNNQTQQALRDYFGKPKKMQEVENAIEFSSERKFSAVSFKKGKTYMLGAPEFVSCNITQEIFDSIKEFTKEGFRVVVLCENKSKIKNDEINNNSQPLAMVVLQDNIRKDAFDTIKWFNENDVKIKIISGDNVDTVSNISKKVGVIGAEKCISLFGKTDEEVIDAASKYNVFGRVNPEQKCLLVKTLKELGEKVAMTGDGVNDILALKEADCSIAMASGSEATRSASDLVMLENNFSAMPNIVWEGRRVINNIAKSSSLFLTKTFFSMFLTIFSLISIFEFPLEPIQFFLWETFFIGVPAFFLALQPNKERIKETFIGSLTSKSLPGALVLFLSAMVCYVFAVKTNNIGAVATLISYAATFGGFFILLNLCLPLDKFRTLVISGCLICALVLIVALPRWIFDYHVLTHNSIIFLIVVWIFIFVFYSMLKKLAEQIFRKNFNK